MISEFCLPDGTVALCAKDVDEYTKRTGVAPASDYSAEYVINYC